jgi:hypothetical protein
MTTNTPPHQFREHPHGLNRKAYLIKPKLDEPVARGFTIPEMQEIIARGKARGWLVINPELHPSLQRRYSRNKAK